MLYLFIINSNQIMTVDQYNALVNRRQILIDRISALSKCTETRSYFDVVQTIIDEFQTEVDNLTKTIESKSEFTFLRIDSIEDDAEPEHFIEWATNLEEAVDIVGERYGRLYPRHTFRLHPKHYE